MKTARLWAVFALSASVFCGTASSRVQGSAAPEQGRLQLIPITSDERLEDIQESPDGTRLITHDRGFAPRLWDPRTMRILRILGDKNDRVSSVFFSRGGEWIVCLSPGSVALWDSALARKRVEVAAPGGQTLDRVAISSDGKACALGTNKGSIGIFTVANPAAVTWFSAHKAGVTCLDFSPDASSVVSAGADKAAKVWNVATHALQADLKGHNGTVLWAWFSEDGKQVLSTGTDDKAILFDLATTKPLLTQEHVVGGKNGFENTLMSALFVGANGQDVLFADGHGFVSIYDRNTLKLVRKIEVAGGSLREIRKSKDGRRIGIYTTAEELKLFDVDTGKEYKFEAGEGLPTAGEFSPNGDVFWVGYEDGSIRRHELETGKIRTETTGATWPIAHSALSPDGKVLWTRFTGQASLRRQDPNIAWRVDTLGHPQFLTATDDSITFSPDSSKAFVRGSISTGYGLYDMRTLQPKQGMKDVVRGIAYSPDGSKFVTWHDDGIVAVWSTDSYDVIDGVELKSAAAQCAFGPDGHTILAVLDNDAIITLDSAAKFDIKEVGKAHDLASKIVRSPDGKWLALNMQGDLQMFDTSTWVCKHITYEKLGNFDSATPKFSAGGKYVALYTNFGGGVWDVATGAQVWKKNAGATREWETSENVSPTETKILLANDAEVEVWDYHRDVKLATLLLRGDVANASFTADGKRILVTDKADGIVIFDATTTVPTRLGTFVAMRNGGFLVTDTEGRYDADDPSHVTGASYVMEWSAGLEPISVSQLKSQFYEPNLLAKLLGSDPSPRRPVPDLAQLHLYPAVSISEKEKGRFDISLKERDGGGIGKMAVFLNGKQVLAKDGTGYVSFDVKDYERFLLPQPELGDHGNLLTVQAANEDGTLTSAPQTLDMGIPEVLKAPAIHLYGLCVGVGDYVGTKGDLKAPPKDATDLAKALTTVANRLLPGHVEVATLTTESIDPVGRPTKENILHWLSEVSKKATSTDVLFLFVAGHGTSSIGKQQDYFFLTSDADPSDLNELSAKTGAISGEELRAALQKISANKQVVILDTCHSGAATKELVDSRSVSGEYQRAWETIKDSTGTWLLAGTAADTLSYESANVDHGVLSYSLLEAIDQASPQGLRAGEGNDLFVDVEQWLTYAANRVESLKNEVGISGVQRPELKRSLGHSSFSVGVTTKDQKGMVGLKPPMPIVIVGTFQKEEEDPLGVEPVMAKALRNGKAFKPWFDVAKHPNVFRVAGSYEVSGDDVALKVSLQKFDSAEARKTLQTFEVKGSAKDLEDLSTRAVKELETRIKVLAAEKPKQNQPG